MGSNDDGPPRMVFSGAAVGGQDAVTRRGPVSIEAANCVFGPHATIFRLEKNAPENDGLVQVKHCSVIAGSQSAVFDVKEGASARIEASYSLFSHPGDPGMAGMAEGKGAVLLRWATSQAHVTYKGYENRYHQLDSYLVIPDTSPETVRRLLDEIEENDDLSDSLANSPWKNPQPLHNSSNCRSRPPFGSIPSPGDCDRRRETPTSIFSSAPNGCSLSRIGKICLL